MKTDWLLSGTPAVMGNRIFLMRNKTHVSMNKRMMQTLEKLGVFELRRALGYGEKKLAEEWERASNHNHHGEL